MIKITNKDQVLLLPVKDGYKWVLADNVREIVLPVKRNGKTVLPDEPTREQMEEGLAMLKKERYKPKEQKKPKRQKPTLTLLDGGKK